MANFALLNKENTVLQVVSINNKKLLIDDKENEQNGIDFLEKELKIKKQFPDCVLIKQTSFNAKFRNKFAGIGDYYDEQKDIFISKKPL